MSKKKIPWLGLGATALITYLLMHEKPEHRRLGRMLQALLGVK